MFSKSNLPATVILLFPGLAVCQAVLFESARSLPSAFAAAAS